MASGIRTSDSLFRRIETVGIADISGLLLFLLFYSLSVVLLGK